MGMATGYESTRIQFDTLAKRYKDYLRLYADLNSGSFEGATPFDEFYIRMTYTSKYQDANAVGRGF